MPPARLHLLQRAWMVLLQATLLLPFVVTKDCSTGEVATYTGLEVYFAGGRAGLAVALGVIVAVLVAWPWSGGRTARDGVALGLRAWVAALGALVAGFGPAFAFLFDANQPLVGWWLHGGGWIATNAGFLALTALSLGSPPSSLTPTHAAVLALLLAPPLAMALKTVFDPETAVVELLGGAGVGYGLALPLALAGIALGRAGAVGVLRVLWWLATVATLVGHVGAGVSR